MAGRGGAWRVSGVQTKAEIVPTRGSFGCARGLAPLRMTEIFDGYRLIHPHPASRIPHDRTATIIRGEYHRTRPSPLRLPPLAVPRSLPPGAVACLPLDLIDEAALRLRLAPVGTLGIYYAGSLPFVLALLVFLGRHEPQSPTPPRRPRRGAGHRRALRGDEGRARCVRRAAARRSLPGSRAVRWTWARLGRLALVQTLLQPSGLFVLPVAAVLTVPLGWVYAFYDNVTALGDGETASARRCSPAPPAHAMRDPGATTSRLLILSLLGMFAWLNLVIATLLLPQLARMFTGEENVFTRSGCTFLQLDVFRRHASALVFLALDPLVKTFYALRCFYADAQTHRRGPPERTARPARRGRRPPGRRRAVRYWPCVWRWRLAAPVPVPRAADHRSRAAAAPIPAGALAARRHGCPRRRWADPIEDVLRRREFAWRAPRPARGPTTAAGAVERFLAGIKTWVRRCRGAVARGGSTRSALVAPAGRKCPEDHRGPEAGGGRTRRRCAR